MIATQVWTQMLNKFSSMTTNYLKPAPSRFPGLFFQVTSLHANVHMTKGLLCRADNVETGDYLTETMLEAFLYAYLLHERWQFQYRELDKIFDSAFVTGDIADTLKKTYTGCSWDKFTPETLADMAAGLYFVEEYEVSLDRDFWRDVLQDGLQEGSILSAHHERIPDAVLAKTSHLLATMENTQSFSQSQAPTQSVSPESQAQMASTDTPVKADSNPNPFRISDSLVSHAVSLTQAEIEVLQKANLLQHKCLLESVKGEFPLIPLHKLTSRQILTHGGVPEEVAVAVERAFSRKSNFALTYLANMSSI